MCLFSLFVIRNSTKLPRRGQFYGNGRMKNHGYQTVGIKVQGTTREQEYPSVNVGTRTACRLDEGTRVPSSLTSWVATHLTTQPWWRGPPRTRDQTSKPHSDLKTLGDRKDSCHDGKVLSYPRVPQEEKTRSKCRHQYIVWIDYERGERWCNLFLLTCLWGKTNLGLLWGNRPKHTERHDCGEWINLLVYKSALGVLSGILLTIIC